VMEVNVADVSTTIKHYLLTQVDNHDSFADSNRDDTFDPGEN